MRRAEVRERTTIAPTPAGRRAKVSRLRRFGRGMLNRLSWLRFRRRRRAGTQICGEGVYYLVFFAVVFFVALVAEVNLLMMLAGMFVGPLWFSWRLVAATLRGLEVRRSMPRSVCAGDLLLVDVKLVNTRRRVGSWAVVVDEQIRRERPRVRRI